MSAASRRTSKGSRRRTPPDAEQALQDAVAAAVQEFGRTVAPRLRSGVGSNEDHLRGPFEVLLRSVGERLGLHVITYGEELFADLGVRPDYVVDAAGAQIGCVEIKAPGKGVTPSAWRPGSHDRKQWEKLKLLPNVLYTDGKHWALYRSGERQGKIATLEGELKQAGDRLRPADGEFARVLSGFLYWDPVRPRTISQVVNACARLCRLLREEVLEGLAREGTGSRQRPFMQLAWEWRQLLFPRLSDVEFADAYAQTVTFSLLLARVEGISFDGHLAPDIARQLHKRQPLMGKALGVLTEGSVEGRSIVLTTLTQVIGAVDWEALNAGGPREAYAYLYEKFLAVYDPALRRRSGSYYTPAEIVAFMVRFVDDVLRLRIGRPRGFASSDVVVVDPAMGTGSFLDEIIRKIAATVEQSEGPGQVTPRLREATGRLIGFEKQAGPFAVAELRLHRTLKQDFHVDVPEDEPRFLTDTLDDPYLENAPLWTAYEVLQRNQENAKRVKREVQVQVVIGNPPYGDKAGGKGGWVEASGGGASLLDDFRSPGQGRYEYVLSSQAVYFWRWATWKVFEAHPEQQEAVVAFITPAAYTTTKGFAGMRNYLRREADEGWIINLSPEGHTPPVSTRVFAGVRQELCIGVFARYGAPRRDEPAVIHLLSVGGPREDKFESLHTLTIPDARWAVCQTGWTSPFTTVGQHVIWERSLSLAELMPWSSRGVTAGRTWVYAPDQETLTHRWEEFLQADLARRRELFSESKEYTIRADVAPLPGIAPHHGTLAEETRPHVAPVRVAYRPFDRHWLIPDRRLMVRARTALWAVRSDRQVFISEQPTQPLKTGPGLLFEALIPDIDHFLGHHGGRVTPLYRDTAGTPNVTPRLLTYLGDRLRLQVPAEDFIAYLAAVVAHSGYTARFADELRTPGIRIPLTASAELWRQAVDLGGEVLWIHTYGDRYIDPHRGRPRGAPRLPFLEQPKAIVTTPYTPDAMPDSMMYDHDTQTLHVGSGQIAPVAPEVWNYTINGTRPIERWFRYRKKNPKRHRSSDLDKIHAQAWTGAMTGELLDLLNVLARCVRLEPRQAELLNDVCASDLITREQLVTARVLPVPAHAQKASAVSPADHDSLFPRARTAG